MTITFSVPKFLANKTFWSICMAILLFFGLTGETVACQGPQDNVDTNQAQTNYQFMDVTGTGACTIMFDSSAGDGNCGTSSPLTFWYDAGQAHLIICSHLEDKDQYMSNFAGCDYYQPPVNLPPGSKFVAVNQGADENTQTGWLAPDGHYYLCEHAQTWLDTNLITATNCSQFNVPQGLSSTATLQSFNSGLQITTSEFWMSDGKLMQCDVTPFRQPNGFIRAFSPSNKVRSCYQFPSMPGSSAPDGAGKITFIGLNSDQALPWEGFYTATYNGSGTYVFRCTYNNSSPNWSDVGPFSNYEEKMNGIDNNGCKWWYGLKPENLPPLPAAA